MRARRSGETQDEFTRRYRPGSGGGGLVENRAGTVRRLSRFAKTTGLLALGLACSHAPPVEEPEAGETGPARRRIAEGCDPGEEARQYERYVGKRALVILRWQGMPERAANLRIPVHVIGIQGRAIGVRFLQFPMKEQYLAIWLESGHIEPGPDGVFLLDPCSATVVEWPELERD